jgi:hypothetical protein
MPKNGPRSNREGENNELKIHVSRVPTKFDEAVVLRILKEHLLDGDEQQNESSEEPIHVELVYPREDSNDDNDDDGAKKSAYDGGQDEDHTGGDGLPVQSESKGDQPKEHRGFGFVTLQSKEIYDKALALSTIRGGRKPGSKKQYTMHIRRYTTSPDETDVCYLWAKQRCPYGDECKFSHSGPGACLVRPEADEATKQSKKGKCFAYKKGKCSLGEDCPFSHDFEPSAPAKEGDKKEHTDTLQSEKDCINWKTKGKCRKGENCPYRHDPGALKKVEAKKKRKRPSDEEGTNNDTKKQKQPLCVRVFGMAYDTTVEDIRNFFEHCGKINELTFPTFEDSGRSKGYCGLVFASPKAVEKAIELNGAELLGRWLSVQAGKMYLRDWETNHTRSREQAADGSPS